MPHGNVSSVPHRPVALLVVKFRRTWKGHWFAISAAKSRSDASSEESLVCGWSLTGHVLFAPFINKLSLPGAPKAAFNY